jgi:hypothetical protein
MEENGGANGGEKCSMGNSQKSMNFYHRKKFFSLVKSVSFALLLLSPPRFSSLFTRKISPISAFPVIRNATLHSWNIAYYSAHFCIIGKVSRRCDS